MSDLRRWEPYVRRRIEQMKAKNGHDPDIANYPTPFALDQALKAVMDLLPSDVCTPSVLPSSEGEGGVELIWMTKGWDIEIDIDAHGEVDFHFRRNREDGSMVAGDGEDVHETVAILLDLSRPAPLSIDERPPRKP